MLSFIAYFVAFMLISNIIMMVCYFKRRFNKFLKRINYPSDSRSLYDLENIENNEEEV